LPLVEWEHEILAEIRHQGEDGVSVGSAAGRLIQLRQRERRAQLETPRLLLLRNSDGGEECFLRRRRVRRIALQQDLAADAVQECVAEMFSGLVRQSQCFIDPSQGSLRPFAFNFEFGKQSLVNWYECFVSLFRIRRQFLLKLGRASLSIAEAGSRPS